MKIFVYTLLCFIWGSTWIAIKLGLEDAPPLYILSARFLLAILVLGVIMKLKQKSFPSSPRSFLRLGMPGVFMYTASYICVYFAERYISSSLTAIIISSIPFFVALLSIGLLPREKLSLIGWCCLLVGFAGVFLITYGTFDISGITFQGSLLAVGGAFFSAAGTVLHKKYTSSHDIYVTVPAQMTIGVIPILIAAIFLEDFSAFHWTTKSVGSVIYLALFGSVTAFLGYYWLLQRMSTVVVSMISLITPLVAMLIGIGFFGESLQLMSIIGATLILSGVLGLIGKRRNRSLKQPTVDVSSN